MSRRVNLPGVDELFGPKGDATDTDGQPPTSAIAPTRALKPVPASGIDPGTSSTAESKGPSGRIRHDEKITVYMSADELLDLEHARLSLRRDFGIAVDRGRIVREALSLALGDVAESGSASPLVGRLLGAPTLTDLDLVSESSTLASRGEASSSRSE